MTKTNIPFAKPFFDDEELDRILQGIRGVLQSGWLTSGPVTKQFETEFGKFFNAKNTIAFNSCTSALHAILITLGIHSGDEVIVPTNTFVATANAALYQGAKPIFVDSDVDTFNIDPSKIHEAVTPHTKAIIVVHLGGNPCDMEEIMEIATESKIPVVEDCAHAHGSKYMGKPCGFFGVAGAFSFYPTKVMTTAEGGMVITPDAIMAEQLRIIRNHGRRDYGAGEIVEIGYNYRLSDIHSMIGLSQLKNIQSFLETRRNIAQIYHKGLRDVSFIKPQLIRTGNECSYYSYLVRLKEEAPVTRDILVKKLAEQGIGTSIMYHPIHTQPLYRRLYNYEKKILPIAESLGENGLSLPMYNGMHCEEAERVIEVLKKF